MPGVAHFLTFWGFIILGLTIIESYGALVISKDFAFPFFGHARWLGFIEDAAAVAVLISLIAFTIMRIVQAPARAAARLTVLRFTHRRGLAHPRA